MSNLNYHTSIIYPSVMITKIFTYILVLEWELRADLEHLTGQDCEAIKRSSALLILKLKERSKLSQSAIDTVVEGCRGLCASTMQHVQAALRSKLADLGFDPSQVVAMQEVFSELEEPFDNLVTISATYLFFEQAWFSGTLLIAVLQ